MLMFFCAFTVFIRFFAQRCRRCSHPAQTSGANPNTTSRSQQQQQNKCYQQKPASSAEPASPAKPDTASIIGTTRRTQQNQRYQQKPVLPAESVSLAEARRNSITSRCQHHQQKQVSLADAMITSTTSRTRHDTQHRQCRPKPAEPADASFSSRASFTSRKPLQNQVQNQKPASFAKTGRNKHHQQKKNTEPASKPEASIISKNLQKQASPAENPRRARINSRSQHR